MNTAKMENIALETRNQIAAARERLLAKVIAENALLRERLQQIVTVCQDNASASHPELALKFVREIAATKDTPC